MSERQRDLRRFPTVYEARDELPDLAAWLSDDEMKLLPIYKGNHFDRGQIYFDLDNPERGPFVATGDEGQTTDHTYVSRGEVPEQVWARLITWRQPMTADQAESIEAIAQSFSIEPDAEVNQAEGYAAE